MTKLPKENESQEIGHWALMAFNAKHPTAWRTKSTDGDDDVGPGPGKDFYIINRGFVYFDTSSIPAGAIISSAVFSEVIPSWPTIINSDKYSKTSFLEFVLHINK